MKTLNLRWQSIHVKIWTTKKVKIMLTASMLGIADRIFKGKISLNTSQPRGPHDHANPATYMQMRAIKPPAYHLGKGPRLQTSRLCLLQL